MPRLVRRKPLADRVKDYLNPADFLLWLSEEFETRDWDSRGAVTPIALGLHFVLLIARANSGSSQSKSAGDVFGDINKGAGWLSYIAISVVHLLTYLSIANAAYTFFRKRHYRLFESPVETPQLTKSAQRVRVDSSPVSSPLRFLNSMIGTENAQARAHPDPTRDVWELAIWDPLPICLRLFCLFSPGHVLVYWLFLPTLSSDPRPSMTVFTLLLLEVLISSQLLLLQSNFSQQEKDLAIIHREVMHEYDTKFVHPNLHPLVRDVGIQSTHTDGEEDVADVDTYTPTVILRRAFRTNPNPNYAKHIDPDNTGAIPGRAFSPTMSTYTPSAYTPRDTTPFAGVTPTPRPVMRQPQFRQNTSAALSTGTSTGNGGSLGVYTHANSPLKKATSMYDISSDNPRNSFDMAKREIQEQRERSRSPVKRPSMGNLGARPHGGAGTSRIPFSGDEVDRRTSAPTALSMGDSHTSYSDTNVSKTSQFKRFS